MVPTIGVDALEVFEEALNLVLVKPADTQPFGEGFEKGLPTACYAFSKGEKTLVAAVMSRPEDTSVGGKGGVGIWVVLLGVGMAIFGAF